MKVTIYKCLLIFFITFSIQLIIILFIWKEKYECKTVIQILPQSRLEQSDDCWNIEVLRQILENPKIEQTIIEKFNLTEYKKRKSYKQLIEKKFQEVDFTNNLIRFRFRYHNPKIAQSVVEYYIDEIQNFWKTQSKERYKSILNYELHNLNNQIDVLSNQITKTPKFKLAYGISSYFVEDPLASSTFNFINFPTIIKNNEIIENFELQYQILQKRKHEITNILNNDSLLNPIPRLRIVVPPITTTQPIWPSKYDLTVISIFNSLFLSLTYFILKLSLFPKNEQI